MKKRILVLVLVMGMIFSTTVLAQEKITLEYWGHLWGAEVIATEGLIAKFEAEHPQIEIKFVQVDAGRQLLAAQAGDLPDMMKGDATRKLAAMDGIIALDQYLRNWEGLNDIPQSLFDYFTHFGKLYALPCDVWTGLTFYNTKLLGAAGVEELPTTWEQFYSTAQKLTRDIDGDGYIDYYGIAIRGATTWDFQRLMPQRGVKLIDPDTLETDLTSPHCIQAVTEFTDLVVKYNVCPPGTVGFSWGEVTNSFYSGQSAMKVEGGWAIANIPLEAPQISFSINQWPPADEGPTLMSVTPYQVSTNCKHPKEAVEFFKFVLSSEGQKYWCETQTRVPFLKSLAADPAFTTEKHKAVMKTLENSTSIPGIEKITYWGDAMRVIQDVLHKVLMKWATPEEALKAGLPEMMEVIESERELR